MRTNGSSGSFNAMSEEIRWFKEVSGCKINLEKSVACAIGSMVKTQSRPTAIQLKWAKESFKYLGVKIAVPGSNLDLFQINFSDSLSRIKRILNMWSRRGLTLLGKVTIIKTLIIPTLLFKLSVLPIDVPNAFTTSLNRSLFTFLWGWKWEKLAERF